METRKQQLATGLMVGSTPPFTLFLANPGWGLPEKLGYTFQFCFEVHANTSQSIRIFPCCGSEL